MYRSRSARSTRSARGSTKSRRAGSRGGFADRIRRAAESGPTRKWVKVMRPPAPTIRFLVSKWVPFNDLTEEERLEYDREQAAIQEEKQNQAMLVDHQATQIDQQESKEHKTSEEPSPVKPTSTEATGNAGTTPDSSLPDNNTTSSTIAEEPASAAKRGLTQGTADPVEEPPSKRVKVDEQV